MTKFNDYKSFRVRTYSISLLRSVGVVQSDSMASNSRSTDNLHSAISNKSRQDIHTEPNLIAPNANSVH